MTMANCPEGEREIRVLGLDGGGYLGLATASFLESTERHFQVRCSERFDLFCGTSTGAIMALALGIGKTAREIRELYERFGQSVFRNRFPLSRGMRAIRGFVTARYDDHPLKAILADTFGALTLRDIKARGKFALIPAFCISSGTPRIFKTNHSPSLSRDDGYLLRDVALASAAAPVYLPIATIRSPTAEMDELFCDGGVFANHPALLGYAESICDLGHSPSKVSILSVSTPRADLSEHDSAYNWFQRRTLFQRYLLRRGLILWRSRLASVFIDSTSMIAHETLRRLSSERIGTGCHYVRIELPRPAGVDMDIATRAATETLKRIGMDRAEQNETRTRLQPFFEETEV
jgi:hypothetical protein